MTTNLTNLNVAINARTGQFNRAIQQSQGRVEQFQRQTRRSFNNINSSLGSVNRVTGALGVTGTFAFGALVGGAVSTGLAFDRMATDIEISTGLGQEAISGLLDEVLEISDETTVAFEELGPALDRALARDIPQENVVTFLESVAQAAELTQTEVLPIVDAAAALTRVFGEEAITASGAVELLYTQSQLLNLPLNDVSTSMQRLAPLAQEMGIEVDDLAGLLVTTTTTTGNLSMATSGLVQLINEARNPTSRLGEAIDTLAGQSYQELIDQGYTTEQILRVLNDVLEAQGLTIEDVISSPEALAVALAILAAEEEATAAVTEALSDSAGKLGRDFDRLAESNSFRLDQALNDLKNTAAELGAFVLPGVSGALRNLEPVIDAIRGAVSLLNLDLSTAADNLRSLGDLRTNFAAVDETLDAIGGFFNLVGNAEDRRQSALDAIREIGRSGGVEAEFQHGGTSLGGLALVGEAGPELVNLPRGAHVTPHAQRAPGTGGGNTFIFNITESTNAREAAREVRREVRQMQREGIL